MNRTIPRPAATERTFWVLTSMPKSRSGIRLASLSINKVEVFWMHGMVVADELFFLGHMQVSRQMMVDHLGTDDFNSALGVEEGMFDFDHAGCETSGGDGLRIGFAGSGWLTLLCNPAVVEAARAFNLMLLRKGRSPLGRHHNYDLATLAMDPDIATTLKTEMEGRHSGGR